MKTTMPYARPLRRLTTVLLSIGLLTTNAPHVFADSKDQSDKKKEPDYSKPVKFPVETGPFGWAWAYVPDIGLTFGKPRSYLWVVDSGDDSHNIGKKTLMLPTPVPILGDRDVMLAVRLQKEYNRTAQDTDPFEFSYSRTDGVSDLTVHSALIFDLYLNDGGWFQHHGDSRSALAYKFSTGFDWQRDTGGKSPTDTRTYFVGFELRPDLHILRASVAYEQDARSGKHNISPALDFSPVLFDFIGVRNDFSYKTARTDRAELAETLQKLRNDIASLERAKAAVQQYINSHDSYFIRPHLGLKSLTGGDLKDIQGLSDLNFSYSADAGINLFGDQLSLKYSFGGIAALSSGGKTHVNHEVRLDWKPRFGHSVWADDLKAAGVSPGWNDFGFFVSYSNGEAAPDYVKHKQFNVGLGFRL